MKRGIITTHRGSILGTYFAQVFDNDEHAMKDFNSVQEAHDWCIEQGAEHVQCHVYGQDQSARP